MAGMFYSLHEAAEKLSISEDQLREIVQAGKLREFRDGANLLFKIGEVEALMSDTSIMGSAAAAAADAAAPQAPKPEVPQEEIPLDLEIPEQAAPGAEIPMGLEASQDEALELEIAGEAGPEVEVPAEPAARQAEAPAVEAGPEAEIPMELEMPEAEAPALEIPEEAVPEAEIPMELEMPEAEAPALEIPEEAVPEAEIPMELDAAEAVTPEEQIFEPDIPEMEIPPEPEAPQAEAGELDDLELEIPDIGAPAGPLSGTSEILLAPETGVPVIPSELTNADTAITGEGVSVLGETDKDYAVTDDTLSETMGTLGATGSVSEASLEEIEGDVNLDSFGSGSGLLDLSLQADDTSLGGILDEIYTSDEESVEPAEAGTVEEVVAEADQIEEDFVAPQVIAGYGQRFEPAPDTASNILGAMLFLPLFLVIYTAIIVVAGLKGVIPSVLTPIQGFAWYLMGGLMVAALVVSVVAFMSGRESVSGAKKAKKAKKPKKAKQPKKAKKPKKGK